MRFIGLDMLGGITMRLIDDKGRLFGKLNIIDFLVLVFILCLMPMFYYGWKIMNRPTEIKPPTITFDKAEYEEYTRKVRRLEAQRDALLKEHKRLRKYF